MPVFLLDLALQITERITELDEWKQRLVIALIILFLISVVWVLR